MFGWRTRRAKARIVRTHCAVCGRVAAEAALRKAVDRWNLVYTGIVAGTGPSGRTVTRHHARLVVRAFRRPYRCEKFERADLHDQAGFCIRCKTVYCWVHWGSPTGKGGRCPKGHVQNLDPDWSPDWGDDA